MIFEFLKKHLTLKMALIAVGVVAINSFLIFSMITRKAPIVIEDFLALILFNGMYFGFYILKKVRS
ncbi:hypothetical protein [Bdellovibrio sp. HCB288]|uniref:hypothetical protein n=1 Tax=Bdellovibrio sp. HCB288 TaxID=3394355 RepID=UPI0039B674F2